MNIKEPQFESIQEAVNYFYKFLPDPNNSTLNISREEFNIHNTKIILSATKIDEAGGGSYWDVWI